MRAGGARSALRRALHAANADETWLIASCWAPAHASAESSGVICVHTRLDAGALVEFGAAAENSRMREYSGAASLSQEALDNHKAYGTANSTADMPSRARTSPAGHRQETSFPSALGGMHPVLDRRHRSFARLVPNACIVKDSPRQFASRGADFGMLCLGELRHGRGFLEK